MRAILLVAFVSLLGLTGRAFAAPCAGFSDVEDTDPFCPHVEWVKNRSITFGCAAGLYCPAEPTSRLAMAAFLHRLGTALLPENVIWISDLQPIQPVIDQAKLVAHQLRPIVIRLAPGRYYENIILAPWVYVEGSGVDVTYLGAPTASPACEQAGSPVKAVVTPVRASRISNLTIENLGGAGMTQCVGVWFASDSSEAFPDTIRNVKILMFAQSPQAAIRISSAVSSITLEGVKIETYGAGPAFGILVDEDAAPGLSVLRSTIQVTGTGGATGIRTSSGGTDLEDSSISAWSSPAIALDVRGTFAGTARVRNGSLSSVEKAIRSAAGPIAVTFMGGTFVSGAIDGTVLCTHAYQGASFLPLSC